MKLLGLLLLIMTVVLFTIKLATPAAWSWGWVLAPIGGPILVLLVTGNWLRLFGRLKGFLGDPW